ncbi:MAG: 6,7-dimethyl-8-ribityllumazine synthase [Gammaproteobacteria bacterium]|nr:6,7-dimethyl-8-ribityllumazine synthase [Gammaproteobacteria bacterium]
MSICCGAPVSLLESGVIVTTIRTIEGSFLAAQDARIAIISARFNRFIVDQLEAGALDVLLRHGVPQTQIAIARVPGAFELPVAAKRLAHTGNYEAIIALGCVIRGGTSHFEYVAGTCADGLARVATETGVPVAFGVLTVEDLTQAIERAGTKAGNKGADAAQTALEMIGLFRQL